MDKVLRYAILAGLFAILFIPFIVSEQFFFPFITGKAFAFRIIVEIVFALWVILALRDPSVRPKKSALLFALGAFVVSLGISTVLAENPSKAFWSNFERMEGYITILHLVAYFLVVSTMLVGEKLWKRFWNVSIGVSVLVALYGVFQLAGVLTINQGGVRVDATFGNATYLAVYMLFHAFMTLYALIKWKSARWTQLAYGGALVLQVLMIFYTATRGTILGLVGGLFLAGLIFLIFGKERPQARKAGAVLVVALILLAGGFFAIKDTSFVQGNAVLSRIASISLTEGQTRFTIWGMAWQGFKERPVFGWGQEGFNFVFNEYYKPSLYAQEPWFDRVHNIFFDWLVAGGIVGLLLYLSFFAIPLWYLWRKGSGFDIAERAILTGLFAGYGFHNLFVFDNLMSYILFFSLIAFIGGRARQGREIASEAKAGRAPQARALSGMPLQAASVVVVLAAFATLYVANVPGMTRAAGIIDALRPYESGIAQNFEQFKKVIGPSGIGRQEAHEQLIQFASQVRNQQFASATTPEFRDEIAQFAIDRFGEEVERAPNDTRLRIFYGSFLRQVGLFDAAETHTQKALGFSPQKQSILFELALLASDQENLAIALPYFKQAYELDPAYDRARIFYVATAIRTGNKDVADQLLTERFGASTPNDPFILQAYLDVGDVARVTAILEKSVEDDPNNPQTWLQLAAAYLESNRRLDAIDAIEEAIRLDPEFTEQGEFFISEIQAGRNP